MKLMCLTCFLMFITGSAVAAEDIAVVGHIKQTVTVPSSRLFKAQSAPKQITLLKIQLSDKAKHTIADRVNNVVSQAQDVSVNSESPLAVQLGMNNVPVLNQGGHGTCATFANTAAINATLNKGDYISQLCQLQLGRFLESSAYTPSGWDGSLGQIVLNQMVVFGIVSKERQQVSGCGGLNEYPLYEEDPVSEMTVTDYHQLSEEVNKVAWTSLLDIYQAVLDQDLSRTLNDVKVSLNKRDRVTFGVMLVDVDLGVAGAVGKHHAVNDTWILTPEMAEHAAAGELYAGHEMIITGYDDNAVAIDDQGLEHRGLLTLRNSWGPAAGDKGDFYMSYDYFKTLVIEAQRIRALVS